MSMTLTNFRKSTESDTSKMTKTGHIATITQLEDAAISTYDKRDLGDSINIIDKDIDNQIRDHEDLVNNNESKGIVLGTGQSPVANGSVRYESETVIYDKVKFHPNGYEFLGLKFVSKLKFDKIISISLIHMLFIYTFFNTDQLPVSLWTWAWGFLMGGIGGFGVTGGAHRFWSHRAYKAKTPLRVILMLCFSLSGQNTLYDWVRDHRVHHKFSETDADPHNSNRGFFFAHVGWLMMHKHPDVIRKGNMLDMSDVLDDPVVQFHQKYFIPLKLMLCFVLPTIVPIYGWGECFFWAFFSQCVLRYVMNLNFTWLVNSAAHMWGTRPYDQKINPVQNLTVSVVAMGEGWHNYHHVFPWDYKAAELGHYFNVTTFWIQLFAKIGWAYDLKEPSKELIRRTVEKCGDGSHATFGHHMSEVPPPDEIQDNHLKQS